MTEQTKSVAYHYGEINKIAETLEAGLDISEIDQLIEMTGKVAEHYKAAKKRLLQIEKAAQMLNTGLSEG